jgi:hypothetical protein
MGALRELAGWYSQYRVFLAIWIATPLVLGAMGARWVAARAPTASEPVARWRPNAALVVCMTLFAVFALTYVSLIYSREELVGQDYGQLTAFRFIDMPIRAASGRFFPLGLQEYNLLTFVGRTPPVYHTFSMLQLVALVMCVVALLGDLPDWFRVVVPMGVMVLTSVVMSFFGLVFPERDLLFWLAIFLVSMQRFSRNPRSLTCWSALASAQFALYYKEPVFLLIGGFAATRLVLFWRARRGPIWKEHWLETALLLQSAVFLLLYVVLVLPHVKSLYTDMFVRRGLWATAGWYARTDLLLSAFVVTFAWRLADAAASKRSVDAFWEPLACGAILYGLAYVKLQLIDAYYMAPVDFVGALYLARIIFEAWQTRRRVLLAASLLVASASVSQQLRSSAFYILNRKTIMAGQARMAAFVHEYAEGRPGDTVTVFFPTVRGFLLMELSSYWRYNGMRLAGDDVAVETRAATIVMKSPRVYPNDRCVSFRVFKCYYAAAPAPGDLALFPPGSRLDSASRGAIAVFRYRPELSRLERVLRWLAPSDRFSPDWATAVGFKY